ncbi:hypothetical protein EX30DRAFT_112433 [Ascodesmis nigricans]|uniref:Uncharacterized protein n=1 Tax=Ascodesmis nigricans TaxID=341454 RepID=A0A4S2MQ75_9PEZI|nr:hypothetical protein EX30DRAFT_112433 [Ascodesmis nigricans]
MTVIASVLHCSHFHYSYQLQRPIYPSIHRSTLIITPNSSLLHMKLPFPLGIRDLKCSNAPPLAHHLTSEARAFSFPFPSLSLPPLHGPPRSFSSSRVAPLPSDPPLPISRYSSSPATVPSSMAATASTPPRLLHTLPPPPPPPASHSHPWPPAPTPPPRTPHSTLHAPQLHRTIELHSWMGRRKQGG